MDDPKKTNWELVERQITKKNDELSTEVISQNLQIKKEIIQAPEGIIMQYKAKSIQKKAAIKSLKLWYDSQYEVAQVQMKRAVEIKSREIAVEAERFLAELDRRHLEFLQDLEFKNIEQKMKALVTIGDKTSEMLKSIMERDWPPSMVDKTISAIKDIHENFFNKVMEE